jgi:hypothetical protein
VSAALDIPVYETAERVDVEIDWSLLDMDLLCEPLDPVEDVDDVTLLGFGALSQEEVSDKLVSSTMSQVDLSLYVLCQPGNETSCWLSEMAMLGSVADPAEFYLEDEGSFLLGLYDEGGGRSFAYLQPSATSEVTEVLLEPTCPMFTMQVDLDGGGTAGPSAGDSGEDCVESSSPSWPVDWSALVDASSADLLWVARYELSTALLEASFAVRDSLAAEAYSMDVGDETRADLADATSGSGASFSGFTGDGIWLLELRDEDSWLPIPLYVTVVAGG